MDEKRKEQNKMKITDFINLKLSSNASVRDIFGPAKVSLKQLANCNNNMYVIVTVNLKLIRASKNMIMY